MGKLIRVKARDADARRKLARWGRKFRGVRTVSHIELGFPPEVFALIPEDLLVGGFVDSLPYTPSGQGRKAPTPVFLTSVPQPETPTPVVVVTDASAGVPEHVQPPVDVGPSPVEQTVTIPSPPDTVEASGEITCPFDGCGFVTKTRHGLNIHTGLVHKEESA